MSRSSLLPIRPYDDCRPVVLPVPRAAVNTDGPSTAGHSKSESNAEPKAIDAATIERQIVEEHTAAGPSWRLALDYVCQSTATGLALWIIDVAITTTVFYCVGVVASSLASVPPSTFFTRQLPVWLMLQTGLFAAHRGYPGAGLSAVDELRCCVRGAIWSGIGVGLVNLVWGILSTSETILFVAVALSTLVGLPIGRFAARKILSQTPWWGIRTILLGSQRHTSAITRQLMTDRTSGYIPVGYLCHFADYIVHADRDPMLLGPGYDARTLAIEHRAPAAVIASPEASHLSDRLLLQFPTLLWLSRTTARHPDGDPIGSFEQHRRGSLLQLRSRIIKRVFDLTAVSIGLLILSPLLLTIAAIIKLRCPGPVFYASQRIGQHGRRISMWKFRTMVVDSEQRLKDYLAANPAAAAEWEADQKLRNDPRIIPGIGHFLRRTSLDEIPQLWNVLVGQMSLVGPRPLPPGEVIKYSDQYFQYSHMWPGITGLWQVSGRNDTDFETRVFLVNRYASHWSLWLDAWILIKTPWIVLTGRGAV